MTNRHETSMQDVVEEACRYSGITYEQATAVMCILIKYYKIQPLEEKVESLPYS